jgi:uncharacterized membrane protein HdeD (DUF308 family)
MVRPLARYWWLLALRGVAAIIFGILALIVPGVTLLVLVSFFGAYALVDGVLAVITSLQHRAENNRWWVLLIEGLAGVAVGILTFVMPGITLISLYFFIAAWALITGVMEIIGAIRLRREIRNEWALGLSGLISVILGILLIANPAAGVSGLVFAVGIYAIFFGVLELYLAFRVRGAAQNVVA